MLDLTVIVTIPDSSPFAGTYELEVGSCTGRDDLDVRRETGYSLISLFQEVQRDGGLVLVAACVVAWLVRRRQYPEMRFESILSSVSWSSDFSFDIPDTDSEPVGKAPAESETIS